MPSRYIYCMLNFLLQGQFLKCIFGGILCSQKETLPFTCWFTALLHTSCGIHMSSLTIETSYLFFFIVFYIFPQNFRFFKKNSKLHLRWYVHVLWLLTFRALYFCQNFLLNLFRIFRNVSRLCQMFPRFQTLLWNSLGLRLLSRMAPLKFIFPNVFFVSLFINFSIVDETEVLADSCRSFLFWQHIFVFYVLLS